MTTAKILFRTLLMATFAIWIGGFTFYVSIVVPIGTDVLGSAREQGFITRQVTPWLNVFCAIALAMMLAELILSWKRSLKFSRILQIGSLLGIAILLIGLIFLHPQLNSLLDPEKKRVLDRTSFYQMHRGYLWASTFQWVFGWTWLVAILSNWSREMRANADASTDAPV